jgi:prepilin-type N-terminal cleavage/methylation domain-containing protein
MQRGFTLIETILVIGLIAILAGASTPFLSQFLLRFRLYLAQDSLISIIHSTQKLAVLERGTTQWYVCITQQTIAVGQDGCAPEQWLESYALPPTIPLSGPATTLFQPYTGEIPTSVSFTLATSIQQRVISVSTAGAIQVTDL